MKVFSLFWYIEKEKESLCFIRCERSKHESCQLCSFYCMFLRAFDEMQARERGIWLYAVAGWCRRGHFCFGILYVKIFGNQDHSVFLFVLLSLYFDHADFHFSSLIRCDSQLALIKGVLVSSWPTVINCFIMSTTRTVRLKWRSFIWSEQVSFFIFPFFIVHFSCFGKVPRGTRSTRRAWKAWPLSL